MASVPEAVQDLGHLQCLLLPRNKCSETVSRHQKAFGRCAGHSDPRVRDTVPHRAGAPLTTARSTGESGLCHWIYGRQPEAALPDLGL